MAIADVADQSIAELGWLDIWVNNAGLYAHQTVFLDQRKQ